VTWGGKEDEGEQRASKCENDINATGSTALFASSIATIFTSIAFNLSIKATTPIDVNLCVDGCLCHGWLRVRDDMTYWDW
jgi:hypothetical protein